MRSPDFFIDEMQKGAFKSMWHEHRFKEEDGKTCMIDVFKFEAPLGFLGLIAERLFLKRYMTKFLIERNEVIKTTAESGDWKKVL